MVIETIFQVGKGGVSDNIVADIKKALDARELIKITVLKNNDETPMDVLQDLAMKLSAEPVCAIGNKIVLYKKSTRKDIEHVKF